MTPAQRYWQPLFDTYFRAPTDYEIGFNHTPSNGVYEVLIVKKGYELEADYWTLPLTVLSARELTEIWDQVAADYGPFTTDVHATFGECLIAIAHETRQCFGYAANPKALEPYLKHFAKHHDVTHIKQVLMTGTPED